MRRQQIKTTSHNRMRDNILAIWYSANDIERKEGAVWYTQARYVTAELAHRHGVSIEQAAAVISILSPRNRWDRNVEDADRLLEAYNLGLKVPPRASTYKQNSLKAWYMLQENSDPYEMFTNRSPKTDAFFRTLAIAPRIGVVVDGHMVAAALGQREPLDKVPDIRGTPYYRISDAITEAADTAGVRPEVMQATVWIAWRNRYLGGTRWDPGESF